MKYYTPRSAVYIGIIASAFSSVSLPLFGYLLSNMVFALMEDP
jgi:hypothetical protein